MRNALIAMMFSFALIANSEAAVWVKLHENGNAKLMLDKQSVLDKEKYKRAWVKVQYKTPQVNTEAADISYNQAKMLWFFDCPAQTAATSQVFQYFDDELKHSAAVDYKAAKFIEPVPDTDIDIAMRYICEVGKPAAGVAEKTPTQSAKASQSDAVKKTEPATPEKNSGQAKPDVVKEEKPQVVPTVEKAESVNATAEASSVTKPKDTVKQVSKDGPKPGWSYQGKDGPKNWAKLSPDFAMCDAGRNQSPINIEQTIHAALKEIRAIQKFPAKDIINTGRLIQVNFKEGNMMVLDHTPFQMKYLQLHTPGENTIKGKSYPLEAHFVHINSKGEMAIIGVIFEEGEANEALELLLQQIPKEIDKAVTIKARVRPSDLMPQNRSYYRFSGSITSPPCTEGVRWVLMKKPMTASKSQIDALKQAILQDNNRPVQPLNGRIVLE